MKFYLKVLLLFFFNYFYVCLGEIRKLFCFFWIHNNPMIFHFYIFVFTFSFLHFHFYIFYLHFGFHIFFFTFSFLHFLRASNQWYPEARGYYYWLYLQRNSNGGFKTKGKVKRRVGRDKTSNLHSICFIKLWESNCECIDWHNF